jgi:hypothetical protein
MPHLFEVVSTHEAIRHGSKGEGVMGLTTRATQRRSGIAATLVTIIFLCSVFACNAQDSFSPKELTFHEGFGSRKADRRMYVRTGCCWIRGIRYGDPDQFVTKWIAQHPLATITPVSYHTQARTHRVRYRRSASRQRNRRSPNDRQQVSYQWRRADCRAHRR